MTQSTFTFPETSRAALASQTESKLSRDKQRIVDYVIEQAEHGATRDEISLATGIRLSTVCGRCNELVKAGKLIETERKRLTSSRRMAVVLVGPNGHGTREEAEDAPVESGSMDRLPP